MICNEFTNSSHSQMSVCFHVCVYIDIDIFNQATEDGFSFTEWKYIRLVR
jgi:hypothetical protein